MPPPSQRRPIPKRRSPHCQKKAVRTVQGKEKYLSYDLYRADGLFIPTPYGIDSVPPYKNGPPPLRRASVFDIASAAGIPQGFFHTRRLVSPKRGGKEGVRLIPDTE